MTVIHQLASSLNRRDEVPNQKLAQNIVDEENAAAIQELVDHLIHGDKNRQSDCIKVLYEIGERKPELITNYIDIFLALLSSKNNRLVWGAMTALDSIATLLPDTLYSNLDTILTAMEKGSVITNDCGMNILVKLAAVPSYSEDSLALLIAQLKACPTNQLPMYAENMLSVINKITKPEFIRVLSSRLVEIEKESKRQRIEKVIRKVKAVNSTAM